MLCRILLAAVAISYLICVLVLSGVQKGDLDVNLLGKLQRHNIKVEDLNDDKLQKECLSKNKLDMASEPVAGENQTDRNKKAVELNLSAQEREKIEDNLPRKLEPARLEAILKYFNNIQVKTRDEANIEEDIANTNHRLKGEQTRYKKEKTESLSKTLFKDTDDSTEYNHEKPNLENMVKYWAELDNRNAQVQQVENNYQTNIRSLLTRHHDPNTKFNFKDIQDISKMLSDYVSKKKNSEDDTSPTANKQLNTDTVFQALNQILKSTKNANRVRRLDDDTLSIRMTTPSVEYNPYFYDTQIIKTEKTATEEDPAKKRYFEQYAHLRIFTERPDLAKNAYNYYLQTEPVQQTKVTPEEYKVTTKDSTHVETTTDVNKEEKDIKLTKDVIRQIAESVKDIVLKDLKKQLSVTDVPSSTITPKPTTTEITTTLKSTTAAPVSDTTPDRTTKLESKLMTVATNSDATQNNNQMTKEMAQLYTMLKEIKAITVQNIKSDKSVATKMNKSNNRTRPSHDMTKSDIRVKSYVGSNIRQPFFSPLLIGMDPHPELMHVSITQQQHAKQNKIIIPQHQRTPAEINMAPLLIQTNSDQIPPLNIPLTKTDIINRHFMVTTESIYKSLYLSQSKWNNMEDIYHLQHGKRNQKGRTMETHTSHNNALVRNDHKKKNNATDCAKTEKERSLLNKTDEIMTRLGNIETLFAKLQGNKTIIQEHSTEKTPVVPTEHIDLTFRQGLANTTVNYTEASTHSDEISKKIKEIEKSLSTLKQLKDNKKEITNITSEKQQGPHSTKYTKADGTKEEDVISKMNRMKLEAARITDAIPEIRNTAKVSVYTRNRDEIDIRLKNLEKEIKNLRYQINMGPKIIDQQMSFKGNRPLVGRLKKIESQYHNVPRHTASKQAQQKQGHAKLVPSKHSNMEAGQNELLSNLKNMEIQQYRSKQGDDGQSYKIDPIKSEQPIVPFLETAVNGKHSYEVKPLARGQSFDTRAKKHQMYVDGNINEETFNPYKDLKSWRTPSRKSGHNRTPTFYMIDTPAEFGNQRINKGKEREEEIKGFHEKLETGEVAPDIIKTSEKNPDDNFEIALTSRQMLPIHETKPKYDDVNFKNFLQTQEKVNTMLEKILATTKTEPELDPVAMF